MLPCKFPCIFSQTTSCAQSSMRVVQCTHHSVAICAIHQNKHETDRVMSSLAFLTVHNHRQPTYNSSATTHNKSNCFDWFRILTTSKDRFISDCTGARALGPHQTNEGLREKHFLPGYYHESISICGSSFVASYGATLIGFSSMMRRAPES